MSKRPSLKANLVAVAGSQPATFRLEADPGPAAVDIAPPSPIAEGMLAPQTVAKARQGKTMVAGYFSPECARAVKMLAVERGVTVQHLIGEGIDAVLRQNGKHPFGER